MDNVEPTEYLLGFDVGGTKCVAVLGRKCGEKLEVVAQERFSTADYPDPGKCINRFSVAMRGLIERYGVKSYAGLGISCGGPLDTVSGMVLSPPNLPGWDEVPLVSMLEREFCCPVRLCNDADAGAVAEWRFGAGRGCRNMVFLTFGTGLGAGLILDGRLYSGTCGMAGECGHIRLAGDGPVGYGKRGSFEGFCSGGGLRQLAELRFPGQGMDARKLALAADSGDAAAREVYHECGRCLGAGLAVIVDLLNPELIVLGSIFRRAEHLLRPAMEEVLQQEALSRSLTSCSIVPSALGEELGNFACLSVAPAAWNGSAL